MGLVSDNFIIMTKWSSLIMEKKWVSKQLCWEKGQALILVTVLLGTAVMGFI